MDIGVLHPGEMGVTVANSLVQAGHHVHWAAQGRGARTRARADSIGLIEAPTVASMVERCQLMVAVCPPQFAEALAVQISLLGFAGTYVEANALSPQRVRRIGRQCHEAGMTFVDGSLIGPPAWQAGTTTLHLSGAHAGVVADCFVGGNLATSITGPEIGQASALKMCDSAFNKGMLAVLYRTLATAEVLGVRGQLHEVWNDNPGGVGHISTENGRICKSALKGWRFIPEMDEVAETMEAVGQPGNLFRNLRDVYSALAEFASSSSTPTEEEVLAALLSNGVSQNRG